MSTRFEKMVRNFQTAFKPKPKPGPYDTIATVKRIEGDTAWVDIPGSVDSTPVKRTVDAKPGDTVQVRISGGRGWISGNETAPPNDSSEAVKEMNEAAVRLKGMIKSVADQTSHEIDIVEKAVADVNTTATTALVSANGKNTVYYADDAPETPAVGEEFVDGDIWFETDADNLIHTWSEEEQDWVAFALGSDAIEDLSITNAKIANGTIQAAKIGSIDAGSITSGTINADRINASSLAIGASTLGAVLNDKADTDDIPTNVSDLLNDAGYITDADTGKWYAGTAITGTSSATIIVPSSGIAEAKIGDMYLNTDTNNTYRCVVGGGPTVAHWLYINNIQGDQGATGSTGPKGDTGDQGPRGATGPAGTDVTSQYVTYSNPYDGVRVAKASDATSFGIYNANGMQVYSSSKKIADFGSDIVLGPTGTTDNNISITPSRGLDLRVGTNRIGYIGRFADTLGTGVGIYGGESRVVSPYIIFSDGEIDIYSGNTTIYNLRGESVKGALGYWPVQPTKSGVSDALGYTPISDLDTFTKTVSDISITKNSYYYNNNIALPSMGNYNAIALVGWHIDGTGGTHLIPFRMHLNGSLSKIICGLGNAYGSNVSSISIEFTVLGYKL